MRHILFLYRRILEVSPISDKPALQFRRDLADSKVSGVDASFSSGLAVRNEKEAWVTGTNETVIRTTDAGRTWQRMPTCRFRVEIDTNDEIRKPQATVSPVLAHALIRTLTVPEIHIQPAAATLIPGTPMRVPIVLIADEPLKARGIHATFHGAEETTATYTTYNASTKSTQTHTAIEHVDIVKEAFLLSGKERMGFWGNISDGFATMLGGGEHEVLAPGEYPFEVEIHVPSDARPSFAGEICRVFYELSVQVDIPAARDVKATQSFEIAGLPEQAEPMPVRTRYPEDQELGLWDSWLVPEIRAEVALAEQVLKEGDTVEGMFKVETQKPLKYRSMNVRLIAVEKTTAHGHTAGYTHLGDPLQIATDGVIESNFVQRFQFPVSFSGPRQMLGEHFTIDCFLQIELDVPWAKDPTIRVPVMLM